MRLNPLNYLLMDLLYCWHGGGWSPSEPCKYLRYFSFTSTSTLLGHSSLIVGLRYVLVNLRFEKKIIHKKKIPFVNWPKQVLAEDNMACHGIYFSNHTCNTQLNILRKCLLCLFIDKIFYFIIMLAAYLCSVATSYIFQYFFWK